MQVAASGTRGKWDGSSWRVGRRRREEEASREHRGRPNARRKRTGTRRSGNQQEDTRTAAEASMSPTTALAHPSQPPTLPNAVLSLITTAALPSAPRPALALPLPGVCACGELQMRDWFPRNQLYAELVELVRSEGGRNLRCARKTRRSERPGGGKRWRWYSGETIAMKRRWLPRTKCVSIAWKSWKPGWIVSRISSALLHSGN